MPLDKPVGSRWRRIVLHRPAATVLGGVVCSIVFSQIALAGLVAALGLGFGGDYPAFAMIAVVVPVVVAGPVSWFAVRLLGEVDEARRRALQLAWRDELTGLYNRRRFAELAQREIDVAFRTGGPLAMVLLDLDHFAAVNDRYGHAAGDAVLSDIGATIAATLRGTDLAARWGGEEFALVLLGTSPADALVATERLLDVIRTRRIAVPGGAVLSCHASVGVAALTADNAHFEGLVKAADRAMHEAKAAGRNRVVVAGATQAARRATAASPANVEG